VESPLVRRARAFAHLGPAPPRLPSNEAARAGTALFVVGRGHARARRGHHSPPTRSLGLGTVPSVLRQSRARWHCILRRRTRPRARVAGTIHLRRGRLRSAPPPPLPNVALRAGSTPRPRPCAHVAARPPQSCLAQAASLARTSTSRACRVASFSATPPVSSSLSLATRPFNTRSKVHIHAVYIVLFQCFRFLLTICHYTLFAFRLFRFSAFLFSYSVLQLLVFTLLPSGFHSRSPLFGLPRPFYQCTINNVSMSNLVYTNQGCALSFSYLRSRPRPRAPRPGCQFRHVNHPAREPPACFPRSPVLRDRPLGLLFLHHPPD